MSYPHNKLGSSVTNHRERRGIVLRAAPPISLYCQNDNDIMVIYIDETIVIEQKQSKAAKLRELRKTMCDMKDMIADLKAKKSAVKEQIKAVKVS